MKPEALVILSPGFAANENDTVCLSPMQVFLKALRQVRPHLAIILISFQYPYRNDDYNWYGIQVISLNGKNKPHFFRLKTWFKAWLALVKLNKTHEIKGALSFWLGECALVGKYFCKLHKIKHLIWILGQDAKPGNRYFKRVKPMANELIALSDFIVGTFYKNYNIAPANVVPIGIDTNMFSATNRDRDIDILGAGSLTPLKQYNVFIEAMVNIAAKFPNLNARICGTGPCKKRLQQLIESYHLTNNITLLGEIPHQNVISLMQRSKILLHTSNYEGFGAVIAEALNAGAHVVSFVSPMLNVTAHHYVVNNAAELEDKLLSLMQQKELDHKPVLQFHSLDIARQIVKLYGLKV